MRKVVRRLEPRTLGTKRAVLKAIITNPPSKRAVEMEHHLLKAEELMTRYTVLAGRPFDEYVGITVISDLCVQDLKDRLERCRDIFGVPRPMGLAWWRRGVLARRRC